MLPWECIDFEDHTGEQFTICGFRSVAVNADATRFLTIDIAGQIRLVDATGHELARTNINSAPAYESGALFVDDTSVVLVGNLLRTFRASDGSPLASYAFPRQHQFGQPDLLDVTAEGDLLVRTQTWEAQTGVRGAVHVIDPVTGQVINSRANTGAVLYGAARAWVAGHSTEGECATTRHYLVLKDRNLTRIATPACLQHVLALLVALLVARVHVHCPTSLLVSSNSEAMSTATAPPPPWIRPHTWPTRASFGDPNTRAQRHHRPSHPLLGQVRQAGRSTQTEAAIRGIPANRTWEPRGNFRSRQGQCRPQRAAWEGRQKKAGRLATACPRFWLPTCCSALPPARVRSR